MSKAELKPTLWRTCRALMNPIRLRMFRIALESEGRLCVRDYAKGLGIPDSIASIYLRQLNARGLLGVHRDRLKVYYNGEDDRSLSDAMAIKSAMIEFFATDPKDGWEAEVMTILRAFSHFNRLAILARLKRGSATLDDLFAAMGVCVKSVYHHLGYLAAAGLVQEVRQYHAPSRLSLKDVAHPLARALLELLSADGAYYNQGSGRGVDEASRVVLRRPRKAEGLSRETWKDCGPMNPRKGNGAMASHRSRTKK